MVFKELHTEPTIPRCQSPHHMLQRKWRKPKRESLNSQVLKGNKISCINNQVIRGLHPNITNNEKAKIEKIKNTMFSELSHEAKFEILIFQKKAGMLFVVF